MLFVEVVADDVVGEVGDLSALHVFANRDELHLGGDDALFGIPKLGDGVAGGFERAAAFAIEAGEFDEAVALGGAGELGVFAGEVAIVLRLHGAAVVGGDIVARGDPFFAKGRQAFGGVAFEGWVPPRTGAVIDADGFVDLDATVEGFGGREGDLAHGHADVLVDMALDVDALAGGELLGGVSFKGCFRVGDHESVVCRVIQK